MKRIMSCFLIITLIVVIWMGVYNARDQSFEEKYATKLELMLSNFQQAYEYRGEVKEIKELYLEGLLTEKKSNKKLKEVLSKLEDMFPGFEDNIRKDPRLGDIPSPDEEANVLVNQIDYQINETRKALEKVGN